MRSEAALLAFLAVAVGGGLGYWIWSLLGGNLSGRKDAFSVARRLFNWVLLASSTVFLGRFIVSVAYPSSFGKSPVEWLLMWLVSSAVWGGIAFGLGWIYVKVFLERRFVQQQTDKTSPEIQTSLSSRDAFGSQASANQSAQSPIMSMPARASEEGEKAQGSPVAEDLNGVLRQAKPERKNFPKALIALQYREDLASAYRSLDALPNAFKEAFLARVEENPQISTEVVRATILESYENWSSPYSDARLNEALRIARALHPAAENDFKEVVGLLGDSVAPESIIQKLIEKYALDPDIESAISTYYATIDEISSDYRASTARLMEWLSIRKGDGVFHVGPKIFESLRKAIIYAEVATYGIHKTGDRWSYKTKQYQLLQSALSRARQDNANALSDPELTSSTAEVLVGRVPVVNGHVEPSKVGPRETINLELAYQRFAPSWVVFAAVVGLITLFVFFGVYG